MAAGETKVRPRPPVFRALGRAEPPETVEVRGVDWQLDTALKHDSWAATAIYRHGDERIICKFNRTEPIFWLPMRWLGRALARREAGFLARLADVELVPDGLGEVRSAGRPLPNAVAHVFIPGTAFRSREQIIPDFFDHLNALIARLHARSIAYVDLHKRENIIVGADGRPYLVDFQVSFGLRSRWPGNGRLARAILARLQEMDIYHIRKHHMRCFPELLSAEELEAWGQRPGLIAVHRRFAVPLRGLRRRLLVGLGIRDRSGMARSEAEPEEAFRNDAAKMAKERPSGKGKRARRRQPAG